MRDNDPVTPDAEVPDAPAGAVRPAHRPRRVGLFALVALLVLGVDILSKALVAAKLARQLTGQQAPVRILFGAIYIDQARNSGAAFSVGTGATLILTVVAIAVVAVIVRTARRMRSTGWAVALGLVLGGALGNLVDRLFRTPGVGRGHVVDWISLFGPDAEHWPIFNLADSAIVCGAILAGILALRGVDFDGRGTPSARE
jgi:signal peptidase II